MSFYETVTNIEKKEYIKFLRLMGSLSRLFSNNTSPYLDSRVCENLFCRCLNAENLAREDCTADAKKGNIGIGIKTWVGNSYQKIAEFNRARPEYAHLEETQKIIRISELRNERIEFTLRAHGLKELIYHAIVREEGKIKIYECPLDKIEIESIIIDSQTDKSIYFHDNKNNYAFNFSKSVLMKKFNDMELKEDINVEILDNPYDLLASVLLNDNPSALATNAYNCAIEYIKPHKNEYPFIFLRLYAYQNGAINNKYVPSKSGLNQWNAGGRKRDKNEVYIPISSEDRRRNPNFFPSRDTPFKLILPNGKFLSAKVCQDNSKALMSNPNNALGEWILREVFNLAEGELLTYSYLRRIGIDSVKIEKINESTYKINFALLGAYEEWLQNYRNEDYE